MALSCGALAAPADDYQRGLRAFRTGDLVQATSALRPAASAGYAPAQVLLASILDQAEFDEEALLWFRKAAEQGDPAGEFGVGSMYLAGEGVKQDPVEAYAWILRAGEKNHEQATIAMASAYLRAERGELSPGPEPARAGEWLQKAAALDYLPALEALAQAYRSGAFGLAVSEVQASQHAARAAAIRKKMSVETAAKGKKKK